MQLNEKQQEFLALEKKSKSKFIGLFGAGGTGKTTVIKSLKGRVAFTAPTNKAVQVLRDSGCPDCMTVYQFFGLKVNEAEGNLTIDPKGQDCQQNFDTLVVDETSMNNEQIYAYIAGTSVKRVVLMGDTHQLPPVGEVRSKTFELVENCSVTLTQQMRQTNEENPLLSVLGNLRRAIDDNKKISFPSKSSQVVAEDGKKNGFVITNDRSKFNLWIKKVFERGDDNCAVIAFRNKRVDEINHAVHEFIYPKGTAYCVGERVIFQKSFYDKDDNPLAMNGEDILITTLEETVETVECAGSIKCLLLNRKFLVPCDRNKHLDFINRIADSIKRKERNALKWKDFYRIRDTFCDIRHAYCMTSYKCQGSTFDDVFVDAVDIKSIPQASQKTINQHLYTALSRARHNAIILV